MARIAGEEIERLKREVSIERLVLGRGVKLKRHGKDLIGLCPLHDDKEPSLVVTPDKNLWHCLGACQAGGTVIDWVMKSQGVSFRHAVELLRADPSSVAAPVEALRKSRGRQQGPVPHKSSVRRLETPLERSAEDHEVLGQVADYYHATLKESPEGLAYLAERGLEHAEMVEHFRLGFANRTLGYRLPQRQRQDGAELRTRLQTLGILRGSGHEHLCGSIVIPLCDDEGRVVQMYGRKIANHQREGTPLHLYLPGPHRGIFNVEAFKASRELILCESLIDALTFWCAGMRQVTSSYGVSGFTVEMREALHRYETERVYIAFDRDKAGDQGAEKIAAELAAMGIEAMRIVFPRGMDANEYARKVTPAAESLRVALAGAEWMAGKSSARVRAAAGAGEREPEALSAAAESVQTGEAEPIPPLVASAAPPSAPSRAVSQPPSPARPSSSPATATFDALADEVRLEMGDRLWRIRGLQKNTAPGSLRLNVALSREHVGYHVDTLELYSARQRQVFVKMASTDLCVEEEHLKKEMALVLLELERLQHELLSGRSAQKNQAPELSERDKDAALELLRDPKLIDRILGDFDKLGVVGERTNKLVAFLAATSRKLDQPLAIVIQSSSAAGKSSLMEAVLSLMPEEERVQYSAMTGQSLFYMGEQDLQHKILAIAEEEGAERASYALKLLQSEGELTIASTGKDPHTGRLVTHEYRVQGPVMIMLTTTAIDVDEELLNRCIVLSVDEGREQTRAIHERQRRAQTLAGVLEKEDKGAIVKLHRNAQRLVQPLTVVNPFAEKLGFVDHVTRARRDHMKYLTLIRAIALLHQHQRPVKEIEHQGKLVRYIEVSEKDIALADRITERVLSRSMDELPAQSRRLLGEVRSLVDSLAKEQGSQPSDVRFTRRQVREHTGWGLSQLKVHLHRLEELELLIVHTGGARRRMVYELAYDPYWPGVTGHWPGSGRALAGPPSRPDKTNGHAALAHLAGAAAVAAPGSAHRKRNVADDRAVASAAKA